MGRMEVVTEVLRYSTDHGLDFKELLNLVETCTEHIMQVLIQNVEDVIDDITEDIIQEGEEQ